VRNFVEDLRHDFFALYRNSHLEYTSSQAPTCLVDRHAIQVYSDIEDRMEEIEKNPAFQAMMAKSAAYIKAGRVSADVVRRSRASTAKRKRR
jgi:hypothetical protein